MEILNKVLSVLPILIPAIIAFNAILSAIGAFLQAIHQSNAAGIVGKVAGFIKKLIDLAQGNLAH